MKAFRIFFVFFLIAGSLHAQAPAYTFKVLVSKGKTEVKSVDTWQTIKVGASLKATDEIKVSENSYLGLIHANGKPLEVRDAGSFKVSELVSRLGAGSSVMNKYTDFILSSNQEKKSRLSATGAVHRGLIKDVIILYLSGTDKADLYGDKIGLQWEAVDIPGPYEVIFSNLAEDRLARFETTEKQLSVNVNEGPLKDEAVVMAKVISKAHPGQGSKDYVIRKLSVANKEQYTKAINEFRASLDDSSALSKYLLAGFFEEKYLLNDALTAYQEAIKLAPDVTLYQEAYNEFLTRLGFEVK